MTEQLHKLIDSGATQPVINERIAGLIEALGRVGSDHEKRVRFLERTVNYVLGAIGLLTSIIVILPKFVDILRK